MLSLPALTQPFQQMPNAGSLWMMASHFWSRPNIRSVELFCLRDCLNNTVAYDVFLLFGARAEDYSVTTLDAPRDGNTLDPDNPEMLRRFNDMVMDLLGSLRPSDSVAEIELRDSSSSCPNPYLFRAEITPPRKPRLTMLKEAQRLPSRRRSMVTNRGCARSYSKAQSPTGRSLAVCGVFRRRSLRTRRSASLCRG